MVPQSNKGMNAPSIILTKHYNYEMKLLTRRATSPLVGIMPEWVVAIMSERMVGIILEQVVAIISESLVGIVGIRNPDE